VVVFNEAGEEDVDKNDLFEGDLLPHFHDEHFVFGFSARTCLIFRGETISLSERLTRLQMMKLPACRSAIGKSSVLLGAIYHKFPSASDK
jgi:hypothetical protein